VTAHAIDASDTSRFVERFNSDVRRRKAISYLREWEGKFWITMDQNIKELTEKIENAVRAELGVEIDKFKAGGQYDKRLSVTATTSHTLSGCAYGTADRKQELIALTGFRCNYRTQPNFCAVRLLSILTLVLHANQLLIVFYHFGDGVQSWGDLVPLLKRER
jgi:hypothetical protein